MSYLKFVNDLAFGCFSSKVKIIKQILTLDNREKQLLNLHVKGTSTVSRMNILQLDLYIKARSVKIHLS